MCSNPSGVHTRPVGESEKTSSGVVVVYRSPQCIYLSLSGIYQYSKWTLHKGHHAIHYTPQLEIIQKKNKKIGSFWEPQVAIPKKKSFSAKSLHWLCCSGLGGWHAEIIGGFLDGKCVGFSWRKQLPRWAFVKNELGTLANGKHLKTNIPYPKKKLTSQTTTTR